MQPIITIARHTALWYLLCLCTLRAGAQTIADARQYAADKNFRKAIPIYKDLYAAQPDSLYHEYLNVLVQAKQYKDAERLVEAQRSRYPAGMETPGPDIDLGKVYEIEGKDDKAKEQFEKVVKLINGDDNKTQRIVRLFSDAGHDDYAILTYERAISLLQSQYIYGIPLARLYAKTGHMDKAAEILIGGGPSPYVTPDNVKSLLLELAGTDATRLQQLQRILVKKVNDQPENNYFDDILTWVYTQRNDWDEALMQVEAIDDRNKEQGKSLMVFAKMAVASHQYETAEKAYTEVIAKGKETPFYTLAKNDQLVAGFSRLHATPAWQPADVTRLMALYDSFFTEFPQYYSRPIATDYATLAAQYAGDAARGIDILQRGLAEPDLRRSDMGQFKLQMGDYYLLLGRLWDASLTYSQVDKEFKQDMLGEDARFRNARLAYYRGDFDWAQKQLSVLKASTSDLIANDALYLSVLITENVEDSNTVPLQRYAYADLLLFQNKDKEAETLLDSLSKVFPKHPLNDDIIMLRAQIARKHHDFAKAIEYLKFIYEKYGKDVLGDDAVYRMGEIYQNDLHQNAEAKQWYEQLLIDYPGSTYTQLARQHLAEIEHPAMP